MTVTLNREFAVRHLFVAVLAAGLCVWFAFDGFVRYPSLSGHDLYVRIERAEPPAGFDLARFKRQKTLSQYGFAVLSLAASLVVGLHLLACARFRFSFDADGFAFRGRRYAYGDVRRADRRAWKKKTILSLVLSDGRRVTLDAWHYTGVKDFERLLAAAGH